MPRERLQTLLETVSHYRLALVVAPAGSGKTTLLAGFAAASRVPVAWYRAETWDGDERSVLRHFEAALGGVFAGLPGDWRTVEDAAAALERWTGSDGLLVVDDVHELEASAAEQALGRLVEYAPRWLTIILGSRMAPAINMTRLRVAGQLLEIGQDELRFRAWEVERLFRDFYHEPVPPTDLAVLARRTEGWAAGLQLFHLATRGKSVEERRRILTGAGSSSRLLREYLTWNVMAALPDELRDFLVDTCVLGRLTGRLCDRLLGRDGSALLLEELLRRQIFTVEVDEADGSYRYHEVLRSHLDRMLVERVGETAARERYRRAGVLLDEDGASAEALAAYARAEDWAAARRLLGGAGERLAGGAPVWLETLPAAVVRHEPWLELAVARRARAEGRWTDALDAYVRAEATFGASSTAVVCQRERLSVRAWLDPLATAPSDWTRLLRAGLAREPLAVARDAGSAADVPADLCRGLLLLAAGEVHAARRALEAAVDDADLEPLLGVAARLGSGLAALLAGDPAGRAAIEASIEMAETMSAPWLGRLARVASRLAPDGAARADAEAAATFAVDDPWGPALARLAEAWSPGAASSDVDPADRRVDAATDAAEAFRRLGSGVLEAWARSLVALGSAETGSPEARDAAIAAEHLSRASGATGVRLVAYDALALADEPRAVEFEQLAGAVARETGMAPPPSAGKSSVSLSPVGQVGSPVGSSAAAGNGAAQGNGAARGDGVARGTGVRRDNGAARGARREPAVTTLGAGEDSLRIRTLGGFGIDVDGLPVGLDGVKPRARALLRLLAAYGGQPVHREVIGEALWPGAGASGARSLHVAVSSLRGLFAGALGQEGARMVVREGEAYRLGVPTGSLDVERFELAVAQARTARSAGSDALEEFARALDEYAGDLLPEDGPAEWVVERRERLRSEALDVARELAEIALLSGEPEIAIRACRIGLGHDRYHDPLWRLLIEARDRAGDVGAATRDRREYQGMLASLGVPEPAITSA